MVLALQSSNLVGNLIPVDNAPVDAILKSDFGKYIQGMRKILEAGITNQAEADAILQQFEEVCHALIFSGSSDRIPTESRHSPIPSYQPRQIS